MASRKKYITWRDFKGGLHEHHAFADPSRGYLEVMDNCYVDYRGRLTPRPGAQAHSDLAFTPAGLITKGFLFQSLEGNLGAGIVASPRQRQFLLTIEAASPCLRVSPDHLTSSPGQTVKNHSVSVAGVDVEAYWHEQLFAPFLAFEGRCLMGLGANGARHMSWGDAASLSHAEGERVYTVGAPAPTTPASVSTVTATGDTSGSNNDLDEAMWYGITYTYYNSTYGIETAPATVVAALTTTTASTDKRTLTGTLTRTVDGQFDQMRVYMTDAQATEVAAEGTNVYKLVATIATSPASSTSTFWVTGTEYRFPGTSGSITSYTLGAANDTLGHDQLTELPLFLATSLNVVFAGVSPNIVRFSKVTAENTFADWYPTENSISIGGAHSRLTGLINHPTQDGILAFTTESAYHITGTHIGDIQVREVPSAVGCPFPRTIVEFDGTAMFLSSDRVVYETDGQSFAPRGEQIRQKLWNLDISHTWTPHAAGYLGRYLLGWVRESLSTGASTISQSNVSSNTVFGAADLERKFTAVPPGPWDLSDYVVGSIISSGPSSHYTTNWGVATAIDDGGNILTGSWGINSVDIVRGYRHSEIFVYFRQDDYWAQWSDIRPHCFISVPGFNNSTGTDNGPALFICRADKLAQPRVFRWGSRIDLDEPIDTTDEDADFTMVVRFPPARFADLTQFEGVRVIMGTGASTDAMAVTVTVYVDDEDTASVTPLAFTPSKSNNYTVGFSAQGHSASVELQITHTGSTTVKGRIPQVQLEYQGYYS